MRLYPALTKAAAILALAGMISAAAPVFAQQSSDVRGTAFISGKTPVDPPPEEPKNTHAYLQLSGPAALQMYRAMRTKEEKNECEPPKKLKRAGELMCTITADGRSAVCDFSVNLVKGTLEGGRAC
jgi:hypothetical protein